MIENEPILKSTPLLQCRVLDLVSHGDERGDLVAIESFKNIPFAINRVYYIFSTAKNVRRGLHAHRTLRQVAIAIHGRCSFHLDNGFETKEVVLDCAKKGLLIEGLTWREMYDFSDDCVLMVLADQHFDESDYIRSYDDFLKMAKGYQA